MYITNWHWFMSQSISHCMQLSRLPGSSEPSLRRALCVVLSSSEAAHRPQRLTHPFIVITWSEQTRKWHVSSTRAYFLHTPCMAPWQTPSAFGSIASCDEIHRRPLHTQKVPIIAVTHNMRPCSFSEFKAITKTPQNHWYSFSVTLFYWLSCRKEVIWSNKCHNQKEIFPLWV